MVALASGAILLPALFCQTVQGQETLADLASGGTLTVGDETFSGFSYAESGLTSFDPANITFTATASGDETLLTWRGNISLAVFNYSGTYPTADLKVNYVMTTTGGNLVNEIGQDYTGTVSSGSRYRLGLQKLSGLQPVAARQSLRVTWMTATYMSRTFPKFLQVLMAVNRSSVPPSQPLT